MGKRKHFYFSDKYKHVVNRIEEQENESHYIIDLVLNDIRKEEKGIDSDIIEYINARLKNLQIRSEYEEQEESTQSLEISIDDIQDFF